jgi:protein-arginine kinase activator protein McsA
MLNRTARGHHFDFKSRACVLCGMTHKEFLDKGRPACMGHPPEKAERSKTEEDGGPEIA